jgi:ABC-type transport system substrate-binding protein
LALLFCVQGCGKADHEAHSAAIRLGTSWGIGPPTGRTSSSIVAHLINLLSPPISQRMDLLEREGDLMRFRARDGDAEVMAPRVAAEQLISAHAEGNTVVATFKPPLPSVDEVVLDGLGPFEAVDFVLNEKLSLRRRDSESPNIDRIEIVNFPSEEEVWRRFLGNDVDIVALGTTVHLQRIRDLPNVRTARIAQPPTVALRFNLRSPKVSELRVRRALSLGLNRASISLAGTGSSEAAVKWPEDAVQAAAEIEDLGLRLKILYIPSQTSHIQSLLVIDRQWSNIGVASDFVAVDPETVGQTLRGGDYDAWFFFGGLDPAYFYLHLSESTANFDGYANPDFDAAVARGDDETAVAILERDLPLIPLYRVVQTYAYSSRFCNVRPIKTSDLTWLADVRLCAPGERD